MTRIIDRVEVAQGNHKYDWKTLADGKPREAIRGKDFECGAASFKNMLYRHAKQNGMSVIVKVVDDDTIQFQFRRSKSRQRTGAK